MIGIAGFHRALWEIAESKSKAQLEARFSPDQSDSTQARRWYHEQVQREYWKRAVLITATWT